MKKMPNLNYTENSVLLWMLITSLTAGGMAIVGSIFFEGVIQVVLMGIAILILSIVFAVFTVAILSPFIANLIRGEETNLEYPATDKESIED
jgi:ABC-type bacteriocin/lantibiotic exporter with double-glycine peptidase domain